MPGGLPPHSGGMLGQDNDASSWKLTPSPSPNTVPRESAAVWSSGASSNLLEGRAGRSLQPLTTLCLHGCCSHLLDPFCPSQLCVQGAQKQSTWAFSLGNWSYQQHPGTTLWVLSLFSRVLQSPQTMLREALLARLSLTQQSD